MLSATNHDGPTFHTRSRKAQSNMTKHLILHATTDTTTPDITKIKDIPDAMPKLLTDNNLQALLQMYRTDPFCKHISKCLSKIKAPNHEADLFLHSEGLLYKHVTDSNQKFLALAIPKSWKYTVLKEAHDKLGHQGTTHTYCLLQCQYYWKDMNKDIRKYKANCTLCHREKSKVNLIFCK